MEDLREPSGIAAPGTPRPRTRGARRRPQTPSPLSTSATRHKDAVFSVLPVAPRRPFTAHTTATFKTPPSQASSGTERHVFSNTEERRLLGERLHASGLKRSVVQAQLFPNVTGNKESKGSESIPTWKRHHHSNNQSIEENTLQFKPLAPSQNVNSAGVVLIPSRPTSSLATTQRQRQLKAARPNTARETILVGKVVEDREPMSARDRYYVEQRASTAPMRKQRMRSQVVAEGYAESNMEGMRHGVGSPRHVMSDEDNQEQVDNAVDDVTPRRGDLLARHNEVKTMTEKLMDGLTQGMDTDPASAFRLPGGAVPRDSFFYLRRVDSNPYNLEVSSHSKINPKDYYTVSRLGITHFTSDSTEFQSLQKFERENYIYSLLVKKSTQESE
ncbi:hypothetical protein DVH05_003015 [Phytophthora capsici]|nr:hypothetical protein DVH05_003015 [Phytophthora capsici]